MSHLLTPESVMLLTALHSGLYDAEQQLAGVLRQHAPATPGWDYVKGGHDTCAAVRSLLALLLEGRHLEGTNAQ